MTLTPTLRNLLRDPVYRAYLRERPPLYANVSHGSPWVVVGVTYDSEGNQRWLRSFKNTYVEAYNMAIRALRENLADDVSIVSRRQLFGPPYRFTWSPGLAWCGRCRRPVRFMRIPTHPLLRDAPVVTSDVPGGRCPLCGMRRSAMPAYTAVRHQDA